MEKYEEDILWLERKAGLVSNDDKEKFAEKVAKLIVDGFMEHEARNLAFQEYFM